MEKNIEYEAFKYAEKKRFHKDVKDAYIAGYNKRKLTSNVTLLKEMQNGLCPNYEEAKKKTNLTDGYTGGMSRKSYDNTFNEYKKEADLYIKLEELINYIVGEK